MIYSLRNSSLGGSLPWNIDGKLFGTCSTQIWYFCIETTWNCAGNLPKEIFLPQWRNFLWVLFTCFLLEFWLFSSHVMVLAAQMCFYNQISQTVWFYVSPRAFKIRTGIIASFNPRRQSEFGDKVISTICVFQNTHRECFLTSLFWVTF